MSEPAALPRGVELERHYLGGPEEMHALKWSPDGRSLAACARGTVVVWGDDPAAPTPLPKAKKKLGDVVSLAWHPDGERLATAAEDGVRVHPGMGEGFKVSKARAAGVAWSPDGRVLVSTLQDGSLLIWDPKKDFNVRGNGVNRGYVPTWLPDGNVLVADADDAATIHSGLSLSVLRRFPSCGRYDTTITPDGRLAAFGSVEGPIQVVDLEPGRVVAVLERHTGSVGAVCFSRDGEFLAAASGDGTVTLWRRADWECVATVQHVPTFGLGGLDFHPHLPLLALKAWSDDIVTCWRIDFDRLRAESASATSRKYRNAKVVLLGDSGVGKSGLGLVLSREAFVPTDSTHGRVVRRVSDAELGSVPQVDETREILVWDLAGQPGYRMVHQLHLKEVAVALIVFDSRSETDPFAGVKHWARALAQARRLEGESAVPTRTFLVAARADRGGVGVTRERVERVLGELGLDGFFETSAKQGWQIAELTEAVLDSIAWDALPTVSSNELLDDIRRFLQAEQREGRILASVDDLYRAYCQSRTLEIGDTARRADFDAVLGRVESRGLIRRLNFGDLVLLQPEFLDAYASALVQAAKDEPDGLGLIAEDDALDGRFRLGSDERVGDPAQERLLLIATVAELLRYELVLREPTDAGVDLVFPSQFTRERPDVPDVPGRAVTFGFEGPLHNLYATLAVRLARSHVFQRQDMWRNASTFNAAAGGMCGIYLRELEEGVGELDLFFDDAAVHAVRRQFEAYVEGHLEARAGIGTVTKRRARSCPGCRYVLPEEMLSRRLERKPGAQEMRCPVCEEHDISLVDGAEPAAVAGDAVVGEMHRSANAGRAKDVASARLKGKIETGDFDVFLCHNAADKPAVQAIGEQLKERGIYPWLDIWEIPPGTRWQKELRKQLKQVKSAAIFIGNKGPGVWQDVEVESLLSDLGRRKRPIIPVVLPGREGNPRLPGFLKLWHMIDMRVDDPDPLDQLIWGITSIKPSEHWTASSLR